MQHILVPLDFSDPTFRQLQVVRSICPPDCVVTLLHVHPAKRDNPSAEHAEERRQLDLHRRNLAALLGEAQTTISTVLREGPVAQSILDQAAFSSADLIVVGSHGQGVMYDTLVGSVTRKLVATSPRSLLIVPERADQIPETFPGFVVAVDFSPRCEEVAREAVRLAGELGGSVKLLHVVPPPAEMLAVGFTIEEPQFATYQTEAKQAAETRLRKLANELSNGVSVHVEVRCGAVPGELISSCDEPAEGLLVLGSHGHGKAYDLLLGSIAQAVIKKAKQPLLLVPVHQRVPVRDAPALLGT